MQKTPQNLSVLFDFLFKGENLGRFPKTVLRVGQVSFTLAFIAQILGTMVGKLNKELMEQWPFSILFAVFGIGWFVAIGALFIVGIYSIGLRAGSRSFLLSFLIAMKKVFLFMFLPAFTITAVLLAWAYMAQLFAILCI